MTLALLTQESPLLGQKSSFEAPSLVGDILGDPQATQPRSLWSAASIYPSQRKAAFWLKDVAKASQTGG